MIIRDYQDQDLEACVAAFDSNRPKYFAEYERQEFIDWLNKPDRPSYYVVEIDGEVIGCGGIFGNEETEEVGLAWGMIHSNEHGKGYGKALAAYRLEEMSKQFPNYQQIVNTSQYTFRFFEKFGFKIDTIIDNGFGEGFDKYQMKK